MWPWRAAVMCPVPEGTQDVGGVGPLPPSFPDLSGGFGPFQDEVKELVRPAVLGQALAEVRQDAVVEAGGRPVPCPRRT